MEVLKVVSVLRTHVFYNPRINQSFLLSQTFFILWTISVQNIFSHKNLRQWKKKIRSKKMQMKFMDIFHWYFYSAKIECICLRLCIIFDYYTLNSYYNYCFGGMIKIIWDIISQIWGIMLRIRWIITKKLINKPFPSFILQRGPIWSWITPNLT